MNKYLVILLSLLFPCVLLAQNKGIRAVNNKGTIIYVDPSKWYEVGTNLFNKNTKGNVAIGVDTSSIKPVDSRLYISNENKPSVPVLKLDTPFAGALTDSVLTWDSKDFSVRKIAISRLSPNDWHLLGNSGTDPATNFLGTIDDQPLKFRIENTNAGGISKLSTALGYNALSVLTPGKDANTAIGVSALQYNTTGQYNTATGANALQANTSGYSNIAFGAQALMANTIGKGNSALGTGAMATNLQGEYNTALGWSSLYSNTSGAYNNTFGSQSLYNNTTGSYNMAFGSQSLLNNTTGNYNVAIGHNSGGATTTGNNNITIGAADGVTVNTSKFDASNELNIGNTLFGTGVNFKATDKLGKIGINIQNPSVELDVNGQVKVRNLPTVVAPTTDNLVTADANGVLHQRTMAEAIGSISWLTTGNSGTDYTTNFLGTKDDQALSFRVKNIRSGILSNNGPTAFGFQALLNSLGTNNTAFGYNTLTGANSGTSNIAVGYFALRYNNGGNYNTAMGVGALTNNTSGSQNVAIGNDALKNITTSTGNIAIGYQAGTNQTSGGSNIVIGNTIDAASTTGANQLNIGNAIYGLNVNKLGTSASTAKIGINVPVPTTTLHVAPNVVGTDDPIRIEGLNAGTVTDNLVTADNNGVLHQRTVADAVGTIGWLLKGNTNTAPSIGGTGTDFLGTTDDQPLMFKVKGAASGMIGTDTKGKNNTALGYISFSNWTTAGGSGNTAIGTKALNTGGAVNDNTAVGYGALYKATSSNSNTAIGSQAMANYTFTPGSIANAGWNTALGFLAMTGKDANTPVTGAYNNAIGSNTLHDNSSGTGNVALGYSALSINSTGNYNVAIGFSAGTGTSTTTAGSGTGSNNILIGGVGGATPILVNLSTVSASNEMNIGNTLFGTSVNNNANVGPYTGKIGINTNAPLTPLDARGSVRTGSPDIAAAIGPNSFSGGLNSVASGNNSFAYGNTAIAGNGTGAATEANGPVALGSSTAAGNYTFAAGAQNKALANYSTSVGQNNTANSTATASFSTGYKNEVNSPNSSAFGANNFIYNVYNSAPGAQNSVVMGSGNKTDANSSIALGANNTNYASYSVAMGNNNTITNGSSYSVAMGQNNKLDNNSTGALISGQTNTINNGVYSVAIGQNNTINSANGTIIGAYANIPASTVGSTILADVSNGSLIVNASTTPNQFTGMFNGGYRFFTNRGNQTDRGMFINDDNVAPGRAKVGINNPSPNAALDVQGSQVVKVDIVSGSYIVKPNDYVLITPTGTTNSITLPAAGSNKGRVLIIKTSGSSGSKVTINTSGSDNLEGQAGGSTIAFSSVMITSGTQVTLISDGISSWYGN